MTDPASPGARALIPNPALRPLEFLIGEWRTTGTHPLVPGKSLSGRTSFAWHEGGAFLAMRSEVVDPRFPDGVAIIGSDADAGTFVMTYFDERGVSRLLEVTVGDRSVTWRHDDPKLAQTLTITASAVATRWSAKAGCPGTAPLGRTICLSISNESSLEIRHLRCRQTNKLPM
ncbi:MAG: hypothetical protein ABIT69_08250 [Sphingomicrobium sp.]